VVGAMARRKNGDGRASYRHKTRGRCQQTRRTSPTVLQDPGPSTQINVNSRRLRDGVSAHSISRVERLVNLTAVLALDLAAIAAQSGHAHHASAALHLRDATSAAWLAAETLAEGACR
jgi:hypothetical protein